VGLYEREKGTDSHSGGCDCSSHSFGHILNHVSDFKLRGFGDQRFRITQSTKEDFVNKIKILTAVLLALLLTTFLISGCQSILVTRTGEKPSEVTETRQFDFSGFTKVEISTAFDYEITRADTYSISVTASTDVFEHIQVVQDGQTLKIEKHSVGTLWTFGDVYLKAVITMPLLNGLSGSGATHGVVSNFSSSEDLDIIVSGASSVELVEIAAGVMYLDISGASYVAGALKAEGIDLDISGASLIQLEGAASDIDIEASGSSHLKLAGLTVNNADVTLSGASDGSINAAGELDVQLSGASTLEYSGQPALTNMDISGGSTIKKK
jgi:hypothetical protein